MASFRETDRVFVPFGYNVYVAFWEGHYAAEKVGCEVVPGGALNTRGRINKMVEVKATALLNTPTYGLHMAEGAVKMGIDPKEIGIKRMLCAGEPLPQATRKRLEHLLLER
jgi:phenylacetate-CoA ligase